MVTQEPFLGSEVAEGLVRANGVVGVLPRLEEGSELGNTTPHGGAGIELIAMGAVGPLDAAIELGTPGREYEEAEPWTEPHRHA